MTGALLVVPLLLLSGCGYGEALDRTRGFDYATDRINTLSNGTTDRSASVNVVGAVVVAQEHNLGAFAATLINTDENAPAALTSLASGGAGEVTPFGGAPVSVAVPTNGLVNMFREDSVPVSGEFEAGDFVTITLGFDTGESITMDVPVVKPCFHYAPDVISVDLPESGVAASGTAAEGAGAGAAADETGDADIYACQEESPPFGGEGSEEEH